MKGYTEIMEIMPTDSTLNQVTISEFQSTSEQKHQVENAASGKMKKNKPTIDSMESFLKHMLKHRKGSVDEKTFRILKGNPSLTTDARNVFLQEAAAVDHYLELGKILMLAGFQAYSYPRIAQTLLEIARDLIMQHPIVSVFSVAEIFPQEGNEQAYPFVEIAKRLGRLRSDLEHRRKVAQQEKKKQKESEAEQTPSDSGEEFKENLRAIDNTLFAAALWRAAYRLAGVDELLIPLRGEFFDYNKDARQAAVDMLTFLISAPDRKGLAAMLGWSAERMAQEVTRSTYLSSQLTKREAELHNASRDLETAKSQIHDLESLRDSLKNELATETHQRITDRIHLLDEKEQQRSHTLKTLEGDIQLLSEALIALTREPPKTTVAHNYLSRVVESLSAEISFLKGC